MHQVTWHWMLASLTFSFTSLVITTDQNVEFDINEAFKFGQTVDQYAGLPTVNVSSKRHSIFDAKNGHQVAVYDDLLGSKMMFILRSYLTSVEDSVWTFNNYDPDEVSVHSSPDNVAWVSDHDPLTFAKSGLSQRLRSAIQDMTGDATQLYPYKVQGKFIRRGDNVKMVADSSEQGEYSVLVHMTRKWHKNAYGELYFYDDDGSIMYGVTPKYNRVIVWDSSLVRLMRPPGISISLALLVLHVTYTKSKEKMLQYHKKHAEWTKEREEARRNWYNVNSITQQSLKVPEDISKHLTAEYKTRTGFRILVFDDLFPKELLDHLRDYVRKYGVYVYNEIDDTDPETDNVEWIAVLRVADYIKSPFWNITREVAKFASGRKAMFPYDVTINLIRSADHTKIHEDCDLPEKEWTFLVYLNPNWSNVHYGETVYLHHNADYSDIAAEVLPKYGRAVIFEGIIPHSARPPSLGFSGARLSFATKLSINEFRGRWKCMGQDLGHMTSLADTNRMLVEPGGATDQVEIEAKGGRYSKGKHGDNENNEGSEDEEEDPDNEGGENDQDNQEDEDEKEDDGGMLSKEKKDRQPLEGNDAGVEEGQPEDTDKFSEDDERQTGVEEDSEGQEISKSSDDPSYFLDYVENLRSKHEDVKGGVEVITALDDEMRLKYAELRQKISKLILDKL